MKKRKLEVAAFEENMEERRGVGLRSLMIWWLWISLNVGGELSMAARIICKLRHSPKDMIGSWSRQRRWILPVAQPCLKIYHCHEISNACWCCLS